MLDGICCWVHAYSSCFHFDTRNSLYANYLHLVANLCSCTATTRIRNWNECNMLRLSECSFDGSWSLCRIFSVLFVKSKFRKISSFSNIFFSFCLNHFSHDLCKSTDPVKKLHFRIPEWTCALFFFKLMTTSKLR